MAELIELIVLLLQAVAHGIDFITSMRDASPRQIIITVLLLLLACGCMWWLYTVI